MKDDSHFTGDLKADGGPRQASADTKTCTLRHLGVVLHVHIHYTRDQLRGGFRYTYTATVVCQMACVMQSLAVAVRKAPTYRLTTMAQARGEAGHRSGTRAFTETSHAFAKRYKWREYGIKVCATPLLPLRTPLICHKPTGRPPHFCRRLPLLARGSRAPYRNHRCGYFRPALRFQLCCCNLTTTEAGACRPLSVTATP